MNESEWGKLPVLLSIIIPAHNVASFIGRTVNSLGALNSSEVEVIIVNDGSSDNTSSVARAAALAVDLSCVFVDQPRSGVSSARNAGLMYAKGEYVYFLDGDDLLCPEFWESLSPALSSRWFDVIVWRFLKVDVRERPQEQASRSRLPFGPVQGPALVEAILREQWQMWLGGSAFKRSLLVSTGITFTDGCHYGEDDEFMLKMFYSAAHVEHLDRVLTLRVVREGSATSVHRINRIDAVFAIGRAANHIRSVGGTGAAAICEELLSSVAKGHFLYNLRGLAVQGPRVGARQLMRDVDLHYPGLVQEVVAIARRDGRFRRPSDQIFVISPAIYVTYARARHSLLVSPASLMARTTLEWLRALPRRRASA